jgi:hypothetical protein
MSRATPSTEPHPKLGVLRAKRCGKGPIGRSHPSNPESRGASLFIWDILNSHTHCKGEQIKTLKKLTCGHRRPSYDFGMSDMIEGHRQAPLNWQWRAGFWRACTPECVFEVRILWSENNDICFELVLIIPQGPELTVSLHDSPGEAKEAAESWNRTGHWCYATANKG